MLGGGGGERETKPGGEEKPYTDSGEWEWTEYP